MSWLALVEPIRVASVEEGFALLARELRAGRSLSELLSAILLAGAQDVQPKPVGFKLHACMVIESARVLALASPRGEEALPLFFALYDLKTSQRLDEQEGGWELGPPPKFEGLDPESALPRWEAALLAADREEAERCATAIGLAPVTEASFEPAWIASMRDFHNVGHKPIYATQLARMAVRWKEAAAQPLLRTLTMGLLEESDEAPHRSLFEANLPRSVAMPAGWEGGTAKTEAAFELLDTLRSASSERAVERGVELLAAGVAPSSLWSGILLHASEILLRAPSLLPVHAFTSTHAFRHIARVSQRESTRALALLQALAWAPLYRDRLRSLIRPALAARRIDDAESRAVAPSDSDRGNAIETLRRDLLRQMFEH
ncbi:MAG: hypothetical protein JNM84_23530, partial [Planctomycetes bacterium]|nr:hypothetical protein [Planctomycetota bacterium]